MNFISTFRVFQIKGKKFLGKITIKLNIYLNLYLKYNY